jgi:peptidoglycan/LPS O-acetylase OafA/YrhL
MIEKFRRVTNNKKLMPEVDGLRFLAILPVMLMHANTSINRLLNNDSPNISEQFDSIVGTGESGVLIFFAISGFILALPFLRSLNNNTEVNLKEYFLRRLTRLEPTYFIVMIIMFLVHLVLRTFGLEVLISHFFASLFYSHSIIYGASSIINPVTWSLEVEIQFYILLPFFIYLIFYFNFFARLFAYLLLLFLIPFFLHQLPLGDFYLDKSILNFIQYFFSGILVADCYINLKIRDSLILVDFIGLISLISIFLIEYLGGQKILMPIALIFSFWAVLKGKIVKSFFSNSIISVIGGMCYSFYLLHYPLFYFLIKLGFYIPIQNNVLFTIVNILFLTVFTTIICSIAFLFIEKPFMDKTWPNKIFKKIKNDQ